MTTLAFDGRLVAIDSQVTAGDLRYEEEKFYRTTDTTGRDLVVFGAGTTSHIQRAVRELSEGFDELTKGEYTILVVGLRDNPVAFYHDGLPLDLRRDFLVAGSGGAIALAAMKAGHNATVNRPGFRRHLAAINYGLGGGGYEHEA
ncbi:hypothetical protein D7U93_16035, partial [Stenotrophomonas maltophilia]|nr:hypothetical protein [Stenotrophomonas maltophilia]MBA0409562.1 hypothetical protein [Stenotrophomonas maltophilia]MBA0427200.1 hypothetical protein [Stenotrophomonas maltophilia]